MGSNRITVGDLVYNVTMDIKEIVEYGVDLRAIVLKQVPTPPEGARIDVNFEGSSSGAIVEGTVTGTDHVNVRADDRIELVIHADIHTHDGGRIAFFADGVGTRDEGAVFRLRENARLTTSSPAYTWVNKLQIWAVGTVDLLNRVIRMKGYAA